jgi:hypothetical protein
VAARHRPRRPEAEIIKISQLELCQLELCRRELCKGDLFQRDLCQRALAGVREAGGWQVCPMPSYP